MAAVRELERPRQDVTSPEREKLAARIEARANGEKRLEALAKVSAWERVAAARKAVEAAKTALKEALEGDVADALDAAVAGEPLPEPHSPCGSGSAGASRGGVCGGYRG